MNNAKHLPHHAISKFVNQLKSFSRLVHVSSVKIITKLKGEDMYVDQISVMIDKSSWSMVLVSNVTLIQDQMVY